MRKDVPKKKLEWFDKNTNQEASYNQMRKAGLFLDNAELSFTSAFHQAYKYGSDKQKKELKKLSENYSMELNKTRGKIWNPVERNQILNQAIMQLKEITKERWLIKNNNM